MPKRKAARMAALPEGYGLSSRRRTGMPVCPRAHDTASTTCYDAEAGPRVEADGSSLQAGEVPRMAMARPPAPSAFSRLALRSGLYYGWVIVAVVLLVSMVATGTRMASGVMIKPLEAEFGWD